MPPPLAGLVAAVAYDLIRMPFVFAQRWHLDGVVPQLDLFKVFPRFGAMILGEPLEQDSYAALAHLVGWAYHFSNGATFGVMYLALVGDALSQNERLAFFGRRPRLSWAAPAESLFVMKTPSSRPGMTLPHAMKRIGTESRALEMRPSCC